MASKEVPEEELNADLATALRLKLDHGDIRRIISACPKKNLTVVEEDRLLAQTALDTLPKKEINKVLTKTARERLSEDKIEKIFQKAISSMEKSNEEIDEDLSKAAQLALDAINNKNYHAVLKLDADEFIDLGMAVYGYGDPIKVVFAPKPSSN
jgi:hypothetical protein